MSGTRQVYEEAFHRIRAERRSLKTGDPLPPASAMPAEAQQAAYSSYIDFCLEPETGWTTYARAERFETLRLKARRRRA